VKFVSSVLWSRGAGDAAGGKYKRGDGQTAAGYRPCPPRPFSSATRNPYRNPQSVSEIRNPYQYQKSVSYFFLQGGYRAFFMAGFIRNP
jgi:hypothetical protein